MPDSSVITAILSSAGAGTAIIVILILGGVLQTKAFVQRVEQEAENWKAAYEAERAARETERKANDELRATVLIQTQRADAAVETAIRRAGQARPEPSAASCA